MACMCKRKESVSLTLLVVGLDNAGKTTMVNSFTGSRDEELVPTFGLIPHEITRKNIRISLYDLGGGGTIRGIWEHYLAECHGVIYVIDGTDMERQAETLDVLNGVLQDRRIVGKPCLILYNKTDECGEISGASYDRRCFHYLSGRSNCECGGRECFFFKRSCVAMIPCVSRHALCKESPTRDEIKRLNLKCKLHSSRFHNNKSTGCDPRICTGLQWLIDCIMCDITDIRRRIVDDVAEQKRREALELNEKKKRVQRYKEERQKLGSDDINGSTTQSTTDMSLMTCATVGSFTTHSRITEDIEEMSDEEELSPPR